MTDAIDALNRHVATAMPAAPEPWTRPLAAYMPACLPDTNWRARRGPLWRVRAWWRRVMRRDRRVGR